MTYKDFKRLSKEAKIKYNTRYQEFWIFADDFETPYIVEGITSFENKDKLMKYLIKKEMVTDSKE